MQPELVRDFSRVHGVWQVLLIGEYEKDGLSQLVLGQHPHQLVPSLPDTLAVIAVHHKYKPLSVLEVMSPQRPDLVLAAHVPHGEADVFIFYCLNIEADCGDGGDDLSQLELVEDCCFSGCVQSNHQDPHLLLSEEALEQGGEHVTHGDVAVPLVWAQLVRISCRSESSN